MKKAPKTLREIVIDQLNLRKKRMIFKTKDFYSFLETAGVESPKDYMNKSKKYFYDTELMISVCKNLKISMDFVLGLTDETQCLDNYEWKGNLIKFKKRLGDLVSNYASNREAAKDIKISKSTLYNYIKAKKMPKSLYNIYLIAQHFDVSVDYLVGLSDNEKVFHIE